jgi:hypothetical protein
MSARRTAMVLIGAEIGLAALFGVVGATGRFSTATAYADEGASPTFSEPVSTVILSELNGRFDSLPVCALEDCSDQPLQVGWWLDSDTGNWFVSLGDYSVLVVDDTAEHIC